MYRVDNPTASVTLPPLLGPIGTEGYWTAGNPGSGIQATDLDQDWFNMLQESLIAILTASGRAHSKTDYTNILNGLTTLFGVTGSGAANGWTRLANGLIFQWGVGAANTGNQDPITLPIAYPTNHFVTIAGESNSAGWVNGSNVYPRVFGVSGKTKTTFNLSAVQISSGGAYVFAPGTGFYYISIGN